jgi:hypothetical protein
MEEINKVAERVRKLLRLAGDGGATAAEAELAAAKAQELMREYNLTAATLEASGAGAEGRAKEGVERKAMYEWQRDLMDTIGETNFCLVKAIQKQQTDRRWGGTTGRYFYAGYEIIGRQSNVAAVQVMFDYLLQTIERLVRETYPDNSQRLSRSAVEFRRGAAERLRERLTERHEAALAEQARKAREADAAARHPAAPGGQALVVVLQDWAQTEADLNEDFRWGRAPGTTAERRRKNEEVAEANRRARDAKVAALVAQGMGEEVARYVAAGFTRERAEELCAPPKPKTDSQRRRERAAEERSYRRWEHQEWAREARTDPLAREAGRRAGDKVSLDDQVDRARRERLN